MTTPWTASDLDSIGAAHELHIRTQRADGTRRPWTPIWVVIVEPGNVYVRSWHRRQTGWFGDAVRGRRARIRVPGLESDVSVDDVADGSDQLTAAVDAAYRVKYGQSGSALMITPEAHRTTLRLSRASTERNHRL